MNSEFLGHCTRTVLCMQRIPRERHVVYVFDEALSSHPSADFGSVFVSSMALEVTDRTVADCFACRTKNGNVDGVTTEKASEIGYFGYNSALTVGHRVGRPRVLI